MSDEIRDQEAGGGRPGGTVDMPGGAIDRPAAAGTPASANAPAANLPAGASRPAAGPLSPADLERAAQIAAQVDLSDAQNVLSFGLPAQTRIATFADSLLGDVRNKDAGAGGEALTELLKKVRELDIDALSSSGRSRIPIIGRFTNTFERFAGRYQKVATSIERIVDSLEKARMALLKDMTVLDKMYALNLDYLKQLDIYIMAGEEALAKLHDETIPALEAEAAASKDVMTAQRLADLQQATSRFERRLHDLKLTRMVAIQTAPQVRLIQANDQNLVEKIQGSILTTVPLWKNQIVIAISLYRQQSAVELQQKVTDTTNELLTKNAELLKDGSAKVGREVERGVVDIETLQKVNADLVATLEETISIQEEGRTRRLEAESEIATMQADLRQKLIELRAQAPKLGAGGPDVDGAAGDGPAPLLTK